MAGSDSVQAPARLPFALSPLEVPQASEKSAPSDTGVASDAGSSSRREALDALSRALDGLDDATRAVENARRQLSDLSGRDGTPTSLRGPIGVESMAPLTSDAGPAIELPLTLGGVLGTKPPLRFDPRPVVPQPAALRVRMLGRFEVEVDGAVQPPWRSRRARQLLEYLLLNHRDQISRHRLMGLFWPDHTEQRAENNLSLTVMTLRRLIDQPAGEGTPSFIGFSAGCYFVDATRIELDVDDFDAGVERALSLEAAGDPIRAAQAFDAALTLYGGHILPADLYEEWTVSRRQYLQDRFAEALQHRARLARLAGDFELSIRLSHRLLEVDPAEESAHRQLIIDYLETGQRSRAVQQAEACRRALRHHLGAEPDAETLAVFARLVE